MNADIPDLLRAMAWERAKGELNSMLNCYYPVYSGNKINTEDYDLMSKIIREFIEKVEKNL